MAHLHSAKILPLAAVGLCLVGAMTAYGFQQFRTANSTVGSSQRSGRGLSMQSYEAAARILEHPQELYTKAGYKQLWTLEADKAKGLLPPGCTVIPHESRVWEPWFAQTLQNDGKPLSLAETLCIRDNVILAVANDPRTQFAVHAELPKGQILHYWVTQARTVMNETLEQLGVKNPSPVLRQVLMADAACTWVKSQRVYGSGTSDKYFDGPLRRWPTGDEIIGDNHTVYCEEAGNLMVYFLRAMESLNKAEGKPTGIETNALSLSYFKYHPDGHIVTGVRMKLPDSARANLYWDATPRTQFSHSALPVLSSYMGPCDQASLENLANLICIDRRPVDPRSIGVKPLNFPTGTFPGGEHTEKYSLGNQVWFKDSNRRSAGPLEGAYPMLSYWEKNKPSIESFRQVLHTALAAL